MPDLYSLPSEVIFLLVCQVMGFIQLFLMFLPPYFLYFFQAQEVFVGLEDLLKLHIYHVTSSVEGELRFVFHYLGRPLYSQF